MKNTTYSNQVPKEIDLDSMLEAIKNFPPMPKFPEKVEMCKKHWKQLEKDLKVKDVNINEFGGIGSLYGIRIVVKPYLKKARVYYKVNNPTPPQQA